MHYYKKNIGDYHKKAGRLTMMEHGAYTLLLDSCYDRERFPTLDEAIDWAWARTDDEVRAVEFVLSKFFNLIDGIYVQNRVQDELNEYRVKAETNKRIATDREAKRKLSKRVVNEPCTSRDENEDISHEAPPNHKPITNNHKPITSSKDINTIESQKKPKSSLKLIPSDFGISDAVSKWALENNHQNLETHLERFIEYAKSNAKKYADWDLAFRRAIREDWGKVNPKPVYQNNGYQTQAQRTAAEQEKWRLACEPERPNEINVTPVDNWSGFLNE